jgi:hypothetical protein
MPDQLSSSPRLDRFVGAEIARGNRNLLLWNAGILVGRIAVSWFARVYIYNFIAGPFAVDDKSFLDLRPSDRHANWLLWQNLFGLTAISLDDGVSYHLRTVSHHGAKSHSIVAHLRSGKAKQVPVRGKFAPAAMQALAKRVPWALFGYDKQLQTGWQKDRAKMIVAVDERRQQSKLQGSTGRKSLRRPAVSSSCTSANTSDQSSKRSKPAASEKRFAGNHGARIAASGSISTASSISRRCGADCVQDHTHRGTHDGQERGFYCSQCHDGVMGRYDTAPGVAVFAG